jgi:signal transduction histidine kinase
MYRIAIEAIRNARAHGIGATGVDVQLNWSDRLLCLTVVDDGQGFDLSGSSRGLGLQTMGERADIAGAQLKIESAFGAGTSVRLLLPVVPFGPA